MLVFSLFVLIFIAVPVFCFIYKIYVTVTTEWRRNYVCLVGKTALVTGANTGIGYQTAIDFAKRGARVILACRDIREGKIARQKIVDETGNENVVVKILDLSCFDAVRKFAKDINETEKRLDILVNNAAILELGVHTLSVDGYLLVMQVNYLSQFLLTLLIIDLMKKTKGSRIINVSSIAAKFAYNMDVDKVFCGPGTLNDYSFSKLCIDLFTAELATKLKGTGITVYSADPGIVDTEIFKQVPKPTKKFVRKMKSYTLRTREEGAQTSIYCATERGIEKSSGENFVNCRQVPKYSTVAVPGLARKLWDITKEIVKLESNEISL